MKFAFFSQVAIRHSFLNKEMLIRKINKIKTKQASVKTRDMNKQNELGLIEIKNEYLLNS